MARALVIRAFTLVELLVVIGIIAVLVSILLPALQKAKTQAQAAVCLSNLKQIGQGLMLYHQDQKFLPPLGFNSFIEDPSTAISYTWVHLLLEGGYLPAPSTNPNVLGPGNSARPDSTNESSVFRCPTGGSFDTERQMFVPGFGNRPLPNNPQSFGFFRSTNPYTNTPVDTWYMANGTWNTDRAHLFPMSRWDLRNPQTVRLQLTRLSMITRPSDTWLIADGVIAHSHTSSIYGLAARHGPDRLNFLFADGHAAPTSVKGWYGATWNTTLFENVSQGIGTYPKWTVRDGTRNWPTN